MKRVEHLQCQALLRCVREVALKFLSGPAMRPCEPWFGRGSRRGRVQ